MSLSLGDIDRNAAPSPAPPVKRPVMAPVYPTRPSSHRRPAAAPQRNSAVVSATAALGAVVTGGLLASQASGPLAMADAAENSPERSEVAAAAIMPLGMAPASNARPLSPSDLGESPSSVTTVLPVSLGERDAVADKHDVEALHKGERLAAQAAAIHAKSVREAKVLNGGGGLSDWISVALDKLGLDQSLSSGVRAIIMKESRGNPHAINRWDSNAMAGRPSQGLMQVIPSTYRAYVLPELKHRPITDPVANITAGIRYMIANYGVGTLKAGGRYRSGSYVGY